MTCAEGLSGTSLLTLLILISYCLFACLHSCQSPRQTFCHQHKQVLCTAANRNLPVVCHMGMSSALGFTLFSPLAAQGLPARPELPRLFAQCIREEKRLHPPPEPHRPEHGRRARQDRLLRRPACLGNLVGRPPRHGSRHRHRHQAGANAVSRLRGSAGQRRPELGLEPGRQQPAAQWGGQRQFPTVQQRTKISGIFCPQLLKVCSYLRGSVGSKLNKLILTV